MREKARRAPTRSRPTRAKRGAGRTTAAYARYLTIVKRLPEVEEALSYGTPAVKVRGKLISRLRTEAEGALALYCDFIDREILLQADPGTFFVTDHYANYPMILVRLKKIPVAALADLVERAWRMRAPAGLLKKYAGFEAKASGAKKR